MSYPSVTIIVPTRNAERTVGACIESLLNLDYAEHEIIVVDAGSTDRTLGKITRFPLKIVMENATRTRSPSHARNLGLREAEGQIIAFTDADCVAPKNWLTELTKHFQDPEVGGVAGKCVYTLSEESCTDKFIGLFQPSGGLEEFTTANVAYRRKVLLEVGGFDENLPSTEDWDLYLRVVNAGYKVKTEANAIIYHKAWSLSELIFKVFRYQFGNLRALWKHRSLVLGRKVPESLSRNVNRFFSIAAVALAYLLSLFIMAWFFSRMLLLPALVVGLLILSGLAASLPLIKPILGIYPSSSTMETIDLPFIVFYLGLSQVLLLVFFLGVFHASLKLILIRLRESFRRYDRYMGCPLSLCGC